MIIIIIRCLYYYHYIIIIVIIIIIIFIIVIDRRGAPRTVIILLLVLSLLLYYILIIVLSPLLIIIIIIIIVIMAVRTVTDRMPSAREDQATSMQAVCYDGGSFTGEKPMDIWNVHSFFTTKARMVSFKHRNVEVFFHQQSPYQYRDKCVYIYIYIYIYEQHKQPTHQMMRHARKHRAINST